MSAALNGGFDPTAYGPVCAELLSETRVPPLGPGRSDPGMEGQLRSTSVDRLFEHAQVVDRSMAEACRSGLWLYFDFLDESHHISQQISSATGSFWHGIMHRREPDFGNSKYWFRRVGDHEIFEDLAEKARQAAIDAHGLNKAGWLAGRTSWDPFAFIDLCQSVYNDAGADHEICRQVSLLEWQLLFDFSYRRAVGA
jgi:hypothetical protein